MASKFASNVKYEKWLKEDNLLLLKGWARDGLIDQQIANNMGIAYSTFKVWKRKYPAIRSALKKSKAVVDLEVENKLLKSAHGYEYVEIKEITEIDQDGNEKTRIEKHKKLMSPNITAQIFWLKNRKPLEWRDKHNIDTNHSFTGNFDLTLDGEKINED